MTPYIAPTRFTATQLLNIPVIGWDSETYYSSDYSVADSSYWHYCHHEQFNCYMVSLSGDGLRSATHPKDVDWWALDGKVWVSANRPFDLHVYRRLCELGIVPQRDGRFPTPFYWGDTAPLSVYLRAPRSLAGAMQALYGITRSKEIRNTDMKGKKWEQFSADLQARIVEYAKQDADDCRRIWVDHWQKWPDKERWIADMLAERGERGFNIDQASLDSDITFMEKVRFEAQLKIPWASDHPVLSPKALRAECTKHGIKAPASLSLTDEECAAWEDQYGDQFEWIAAVRTFRRANTLLGKLKAMRDRIRPDGRLQFQLSFFAAHTGRSGGTGGVNMLNLPRSPYYINDRYHILHKKEELLAVEKFRRGHNGTLPPDILRGVDFRSKLLASPGNHLITGDLAQIEARYGRWLVGDKATLALVESGYGIYEAHARRFMGFTGKSMKKEDPGGYQLAKARELALSFGVGSVKFESMAHLYVDDEYFAKIFGAPVTNAQKGMYLEYVESLRNPIMRATYLRRFKRADEFTSNVIVNAWLQVRDFRLKNPELTGMWRRLDDELKRSVGGDYELTMPDGSVITYFNVMEDPDGDEGGIIARVERGGPMLHWHGSKIFENCVQKGARQVFIECQIRAERAGFNVLLDVYDELVCDEPLSRDPNELLAVMRVRPDWARTLPIDAEVDASPYYRK